MTQSKALRLAEWIESDMSCHGDAEIAAELRRLAAVEAQRDALLGLLRAELPHAEWQDKIIHPYRGESWQNWKISIWLPVPVSASDRSPEAALTRAVDAAIKAVEGEQK